MPSTPDSKTRSEMSWPSWMTTSLQNLTAPLRDSEGAGAGARILSHRSFAPPRWLSLKEQYALGSFALFDPGPEAAELAEAPLGTNIAFRSRRLRNFRIDLGPRPNSEMRGEDFEFADRLLAAGERLRYEPTKPGLTSGFRRSSLTPDGVSAESHWCSFGDWQSLDDAMADCRRARPAILLQTQCLDRSRSDNGVLPPVARVSGEIGSGKHLEFLQSADGFHRFTSDDTSDSLSKTPPRIDERSFLMINLPQSGLAKYIVSWPDE